MARQGPLIYVKLRGTVTMTTDGGRDLIEALSRKYTDHERYSFDDGTDNIRVVVRDHAGQDRRVLSRLIPVAE